MKVNYIQKNDYSFKANKENRHKPNKAQRSAANEEDRKLLYSLRKSSDSYLRRARAAAKIGVDMPIPKEHGFLKDCATFVVNFPVVRPKV